jgi:hypothetical protein
MSLTSEAKKEAKENGVEIGKITAKRDRLGYYDVYEDVSLVSESMLGTADEVKAGAIETLMFDRIPADY